MYFFPERHLPSVQLPSLELGRRHLVSPGTWPGVHRPARWTTAAAVVRDGLTRGTPEAPSLLPRGGPEREPPSRRWARPLSQQLEAIQGSRGSLRAREPEALLGELREATGRWVQKLQGL